MRDTHPPILEYWSAEDVTPAHQDGALAAAISLMCLLTPVFGFVIRSGPLFLLGLLLAPWAGILAGITGLVHAWRKHPWVELSAVGLAFNTLLIAYSYWLFFVRGLC